MAEISQRLSDRIGRDFPPGVAEQVKGYLTSLTTDAFGGQDTERIQAAIVLASRGQPERFLAVFKLLSVDWRDVLMAGGLGNEDWPSVLNTELPNR
ncbi:MAG TPA: hypothetical protein VGM32_04180 [Rhodopila sp.]